MQNSLVVAFHRDASPSPEKSALENSIFALHPHSVVITTRQDIIARSRLELSHKFRDSIKGDDAREAIEIYAEKTPHLSRAIITSCDDMKQAATEANIPVIDAGNNFHCISDALRNLSLQHG